MVVKRNIRKYVAIVANPRPLTPKSYGSTTKRQRSRWITDAITWATMGAWEYYRQVRKRRARSKRPRKYIAGIIGTIYS